MKVLRNFLTIAVLAAAIVIKVTKPFSEEVVDLNNFTEYYTAGEDLEEGGGIELLQDNFYTIEKEYVIPKQQATISGEHLIKDIKDVPPGEKQEADIKQAYEIPKKEVYEIVSGDTLTGIAEKYGITLDVLKANNPGLSNKISVGQKLNIINGNGIFYKVKKGDSLYKIALNYKVDVEELRKYNQLEDDGIRAGQEIFIHNPSQDTLKRIETASHPKKITKKTSNSSTGTKIFRMPVKWSGISSSFGNRFHPVLKRYILHAGVDFKARYVPLMAAKEGKVTYAGYMSGYGKIIIIKHSSGYETRSAHLNKIYVKKGSVVKAGEVIGQTGMTGRVTGPHLHFEIRKNGTPYNPLNYLIR